MFDLYRLPEALAPGLHIESIKREISGLHADRARQAAAICRRIDRLLAARSGRADQDQLVLAAVLRELEALHRLAADGITGRELLRQSEEASMVRLFMKTAELQSILRRRLATWTK